MKTLSRLSIALAVILSGAAAQAITVQYIGQIVQPSFPAGNADNGVAINLNAAALTSDCGNVALHMLNLSGSNGAYWIQVGLLSGNDAFGCDVGTIYWNDNRASGGGFNVHYPNLAAGFGTYYQVIIERSTTDSCAWDLSFGGVSIGTSTANCLVGRGARAGLWTSTQGTSIQARGFISGWERLDSTRHWQSGWGAVYSSSNPPSIKATSTGAEEVQTLSW